MKVLNRPRAEPGKYRNQPDMERSLVQLVLSGFPLASHSAEPLAQRIDWPLVAALAEDHGLAPLLYKSLQKLNLLDQVSTAAAEPLRAAYLRSSIANWLALEQLAGLLDTFTREQISVVLLKGCALGPTLYGDIALRPMTDLDLLVRPGDVARAQDLLMARGLEPRLDVANGVRLRLFHAQTLVRCDGRGPNVDLHTHPLGDPYYSQRLDAEWFWQHSNEARVNEAAARLLSPEAQLLHLCAHLVQHGGGRLIWSYDLALVLERYGEELDWDEVLGAAERHGLTQVLKEGLARTFEEWGAVIPARVSTRLVAIRPSGFERFLMSSLGARQSEAQLLSFGLSGLKASEKLPYFWQLLFPSRAYMRQRYRASSAWRMQISYLRRLASGLRKGWQLAASVPKTRQLMHRGGSAIDGFPD